MKSNKLLALLLALAMVFTFAACGEKTPTTDDTKTPTEDTTPTTEPKQDETPETTLPEIKVPSQAIEFASAFTFKVNGEEVTSEQLKDLQIYKVKLDTLLDKEGNPATDKETGEPLVVSYTGYKVVDILNLLGVEGKTVIAAASDGFESAEYDLTVNPDYLILAVEKDKVQAEDGTLYFAPCFEQTNGKYVRSVVELIVK